MSWLYLLSAIACEVVATTCMKLSEGFTRWLPSTLMFLFYAISFSLLTLALREFQVSVAYAVWSGLGTVLITLVGVVFFQEPAGAFKLGCMALVVVGVVGLNLAPGAH